jgi:hypothetical protein
MIGQQTLQALASARPRHLVRTPAAELLLRPAVRRRHLLHLFVLGTALAIATARAFGAG